jgi:hypothetical protein
MENVVEARAAPDFATRKGNCIFSDACSGISDEKWLYTTPQQKQRSLLLIKIPGG